MNAIAIEAPDDLTPPTGAEGGRAAKLPVRELKPAPAPVVVAEQSAFLGVVSSSIPDMLTEHLDLKPGEGVVIRSLVPNGPAASAGITVNAVVLRVAGKAVNSPQELSEQIAAHQPGEAVALDMIHRGKPNTVEVKMGTRPAGVAKIEQPATSQFTLDGIPEELAERIREAVEGKVGQMDLLGADGLQIPPNVTDALRDMKKRMEGALGGGAILPDDPAVGNVQGETTIRLNDNDGSVEVKSKDGGKEVILRDPQGNTTWSGPWDTEQDKAAAPETARIRMKTLNLDSNIEGNGLRFKLNTPPPNP